MSDGMSVKSYQYLIGVLERHCEDVGRDPAEIRGTIHMPLNLTDDTGVGRDPAEIRGTIHMPLNLTDDKESAKRSIETLGPGTMAGPRDYIIDRIGEFDDAGVEEIMFPPFRDIEALQRVEEEVVTAFD